MIEFLQEHYLSIKALHIISVIAWMAGLLYLPRLFVYHAQTPQKGEMHETFKIMEYRLLKYIMNPSMIATYAFGLMLIAIIGWDSGKWLHIKVNLVLIMSAVHGIMAKHRKEFMLGKNVKSHTYYRVLNEVPTVLMIAIVFLAILKPF